MTGPGSKHKRGFTLLEVMVAVGILAIGLSAVFSAEAGSIRTAARARKMGLATLLVRCKMGELEEELAVKGLPAIRGTGSDNCCKDAEIDGYKCKWDIEPIVLPDTMFGDDDEDKDKDKSGGKPGAGGLASSGPGSSATGSGSSKGGLSGLVGAASAALGFKKGDDGKTESTPSKDGKDAKDGKDKDGKDPILKQDPKDLLAGDPSRFLGGPGSGGAEVDGITAMAMQFVYPVLKPAFQSQIRRATVTVTWLEGENEKSFDVTQYVVAEQPVPLATDPNDPNALLGAGAVPGASGAPTPATPGSGK